jgi:hypothetical protein
MIGFPFILTGMDKKNFALLKASLEKLVMVKEKYGYN